MRIRRNIERPQPRPSISPTETRDELVERGRKIIDLMRARRRGPHAYSKREERALLSDVAYLRSIAAHREKIDPHDRAFYVTIRDGQRYGLLYGPFPTQTAALRKKDLVRNVARNLNPGDSAFAEFGTASIPRDRIRPGLLNDHLPAIPPLA